MGACIGKKSTKYLNRKKAKPDTTEAPQIKIQDDTEEKKSSPSPSKKLPMANGSISDHDDDYRISRIDGNSINSELQIILDEQKIINETLTQPFPSRVISVTDAELEFELAKLMLEQPENDHVENTTTTTTAANSTST